MSVYEIPLTATPQQFYITLSNVTYLAVVKWNTASSCWTFDLAKEDGVPILMGTPLVAGVDLLEQYRYLGIGGKLFCYTDQNQDASPTYENLGTNSHLYFEPSS